MISLDDVEKNKAFAESVGADFVLLSDPDRNVAEQFGVIGLGGLYTKRWTFYIDKNGIIQHIDKDVNPASHGQDVVSKLGELGFAKR